MSFIESKRSAHSVVDRYSDTIARNAAGLALNVFEAQIRKTFRIVGFWFNDLSINEADLTQR